MYQRTQDLCSVLLLNGQFLLTGTNFTWSWISYVNKTFQNKWKSDIPSVLNTCTILKLYNVNNRGQEQRLQADPMSTNSSSKWSDTILFITKKRIMFETMVIFTSIIYILGCGQINSCIVVVAICCVVPIWKIIPVCGWKWNWKHVALPNISWNQQWNKIW